MFLDTADPLAHIIFLKVLLSKWKVRKSNIFRFLKYDKFMLFMDIGLLFDPYYLIPNKIYLKYSWALLTYKNEDLHFRKNTKINSYKTVSWFTKQRYEILTICPTTQFKEWILSSAVLMWILLKFLLRKLTYNFVVHSNKSAHRRSGNLGIEII